ncbi:MAG: DinB family protein [Actinomycetota bacterium]
MISDANAFLSWFNGVHRRTVRDISLLPPEAATWLPNAPTEGDERWGIPKLVAHIAEGRGFFAGAFRGDGWVWDLWPAELPDRDSWIAALEASLDALRTAVSSASADRLAARIPAIDQPDQLLAGWRVLMMMAEHEVAHRAQIGTYAGLNGWPVAQIFDRTNEWVVAQRDAQLERRGRAPG